MKKGSDILVEALENEGVDRVFGVPGEENLHVVESLRKSSIELVLTRHEQAAAFMAGTIRACHDCVSDARIQNGLAGCDGVNRPGQTRSIHPFEKIPVRSAENRLRHRDIVRERAQKDNAHGRKMFPNGPASRDAAVVGQADIHHNDVGRQLTRGLDRRRRRADITDHRNAGIAFQKRPQAFSHHFMVFHEKNANSLSRSSAHSRPVAVGSSTVTVVPLWR